MMKLIIRGRRDLQFQILSGCTNLASAFLGAG